MKKLLILYFSGVGNTKRVAEYINNQLEKSFIVSLRSIEMGDIDCSQYDAVVIGFPTYHAESPRIMVDYVTNNFNKIMPAFIFTTCGLYSANAIRDFAKEISVTGIYPILSKSFRCTATDGMLIAPSMQIWFKDEKLLYKKIDESCEEFTSLLNKSHAVIVPRFKLYSILNVPNKWMGKCFKAKIYLSKDRCKRCGACVKKCPVSALERSSDDLPSWNVDRCIRCFRCIYLCREKALSISKASKN